MPKEIIDTHIHVWDFSKAKYTWLDGDTSILNRTYSIDELESERKEAGVTAGILVQAANNFEDTDWMLQIAAERDWIKGVVGWLPLESVARTEKALKEKYLHNTYFKGVRHLIHNEADPQWLLQEDVLKSLHLLAKHNLPYDVVGVNIQHFQTAIKVSEKVEGLQLVLDHANQPPIPRKEKFGEWGELMEEAAKKENIHIKISGLGTTSGNFLNWTENDIQPYIEFLLEHFGVDRCFCGGDWPVSLLAGSYNRTWRIYKLVLTKLLSESEQEKVFFSNALNFYHL